MEHTVKQVANKSRDKVAIIQSIDRKIPLDYIAEQVGMSMEDLLNELNMIVDAGTKLNIDYYLNDNMDEEVIEEIFDYFNDDAGRRQCRERHKRITRRRYHNGRGATRTY